jgi:hypothetical protein
MTTSPLRFLLLLGTLALPLSAQTVTTLINDTFTDLDRTNQSLPASSAWFTSGTNVSTNIDASGGALIVKNGLTTLTYFTASGSPVNLAVGESLTLSFTVSFSAVADAAGTFRVGLFNSGTRFTADAFGNTNAAFSGNYAGYLGVVNPGATSGTNIFRVYERSANNNLTSGSLTNFTQTGGSSGGTFKTFAIDTVYSAMLTLTLVDATTLSINQSYTGVFSGDSVTSTASATISDTSGLTTSFDTLSFYYNNTANLTFDNIKLDYTSAIPEPATVAMLAGFSVLGLAALRRRRHV